MATSREEKVKDISHSFLVLLPTGEEIFFQIDQIYSLPVFAEHPAMRQMLEFEEVKGKQGTPPPSIQTMKRLELVDYEPASDSGHFRFYPKGAMMLKLLEDWAEDIANSLGAMPIHTPVLYDWNNPSIRSQAESFHERHYMVSAATSKREFVLRFAGDFGLFLMLKDAKISRRQLPIRMYEYSPSYRYEKRGELAGLRRLRGFSMPDIHSFCSDIDQSWVEYQALYKQYADLATATGVEYAIIFRCVDVFFEQFKDQIVEMLRYSGRPAVIEILSGMKHYWAVKHEFQGIDSVGGSCQVATVQLDVEDAERYGITYVDESGDEKGCVICHSSIGALERWIFLMLEQAHMMDVPQLPLWVTPEQVRIVPVSEDHLPYAVEVAKQLSAAGIRTGVDDRSETLQYRIRAAETQWIPFIAVVGNREIENGSLSIRERGVGQSASSVPELVSKISGKTAGMPNRPLPVPMLVSARPIFFG